ncbi:prepronociceptin isoform X1 [Lagopus muta]|uniref:prepronociceptin isoform X1 n=1 Tax=Lagopus muta TaxID=64668 RepID=UPI00209CC7C0|nr:prepronociceptin isoform X1 [Lagopus muta]
MRAVLWDLLLLCLFARARSDCRGDCLHCDRHFYRDGFDLLVCILECEGEAVPRATWEMCATSIRSAPRPGAVGAGVLGAMEPAEAVASPLQVSELLRRRDAEDGGAGMAPGAFPSQDEDISRRLGGGFPRGTRGSWPAARGVQKRYGGFIGVRKSARKWNNQKRFSEFLKQYLGMSPRSTFRHRVPAPSARHRQN